MAGLCFGNRVRLPIRAQKLRRFLPQPASLVARVRILFAAGLAVVSLFFVGRPLSVLAFPAALVPGKLLLAPKCFSLSAFLGSRFHENL